MLDPSENSYASLAADAPVATTTDVATTATNAATENAAPSLSLGDIAQGIMGTGTAKGAAIGALFSELLRQSAQAGGILSPVDFSKYGIPARQTTVAPPRYVPYAEYGARDIPDMSPELMQSFGAPAGLGGMMPTSQYTATPAMASNAPMTISSPGSGQSLMPTLNLTPRSNKPISPLTGALLGGALGYLTSPESSASSAGANAMRQLYGATTGGLSDIGKSLIGSAGNVIGNLFGKKTPLQTTGSQGEAYYQQYGKTYAQSPDGTVRLVYDPSSGEGSAGIYNPDDFGGENPSWMSSSDPNYFSPNSSYYSPTTTPSYLTDYVYEQPTTYQPTFSGGSLYGSYYNPYVEPDISYGYVNNDSSSYYKKGGMATPLMADGGMAGNPMQDQPAPSFYTYGTVIDPMDMMNGAQVPPMGEDMQSAGMESPIDMGAAMNPSPAGMARGGSPQGGLHVPTVQGRHDYRAGSRVMGEGDGQSDDIPAMLADGEYVFDADTVAQLGNGSSKAGSDMLDKFREEIRAHKRSAPVNKIPPASKSPLQYLKQAQSRSNKNG